MKAEAFKQMVETLKLEIPDWDKNAKHELDILSDAYFDDNSERLKEQIIQDFLLIDARVHKRERKELNQI